MGNLPSICLPRNWEDMLTMWLGIWSHEKAAAKWPWHAAPELVTHPVLSQAPRRGASCRWRFGARAAVPTVGSVPSTHCACTASCGVAELFPEEGEEKKCMLGVMLNCRSCWEESWGSRNDSRLIALCKGSFRLMASEEERKKSG